MLRTKNTLLGKAKVFILVFFCYYFLTINSFSEIINKYSLRINKGVLLDNNFVKPQAFHKYPVTRSGGMGSIICLIIFFYLLQ